MKDSTLSSLRDASGPLTRNGNPEAEYSSKEEVTGMITAKPTGTVSADWDGPDDEDNPWNWPMIHRLFGILVPAWYAFAVTLGASIYAAGIADIEVKFQVSGIAAIAGLSVYACGIGLGPVLGAPISETFGRRWVYLCTMPPFLLFTLGAGLATNIETLLVCRFFSAALGAPGIAVGAGSVADLFDMQKGGGVAGTFFVLMPFLGSSLGPLVGGYTMEARQDFSWTMWVLMMVAGPAWIASFFQRESSKKIILRNRAIKRGEALPPRPPAKQFYTQLVTVTLIRPVHMLLTEPIIGWMALYSAFVFGILFACFDAFPYIFGSTYGFDLGAVGLPYLGIVGGVLSAGALFIIVDKTMYARCKARVTEAGKIPPPEERLYVCMIGSIMLPVSLFWFAWSTRPSVHWIVPILAGLPFGCAMVLLFLGTSVYLVDAYQALNTASAIAAVNLLRYLFGAAFPLFTVQMFERLGIQWAISLFGFISVVMLPFPWILYKWGPQLRARSSYKMGNF